MFNLALRIANSIWESSPSLRASLVRDFEYVGCAANAHTVGDQAHNISPEHHKPRVLKPILPARTGSISGSLNVDAKRSYYDGVQHQLQVCLYDDNAWPKYQASFGEGTLCRARVGMANFCFAAHASSSTAAAKGKDGFAFDFAKKIDFKAYTHFMFAVLADCMLEEYPANPPPLRFHLEFRNGESHLPADEIVLPGVHAALALLLFGALVFYLVQMQRQAISFGQVHLISLLLGAALVLQLLALIVEYRHLRAFALDGRGYTTGIGASAARIMQMGSELIVSCTLVSLALGWTFVSVDGGSLVSASAVGGSSKSSGGMLASGSGGARSVLFTACAAISFTQLVLEAWSELYFDELNQFHDFEHTPGFILMAFRLALAAFFFVKISATAAREVDGSPLRALLGQLRTQGVCWFAAFPVLVAVAAVLPPSWRHEYVTGCSLGVQAVALARLMFMFFDPSSAFFKHSTLRELSLAGGLGGSASASSSSNAGGSSSNTTLSAPSSSSSSQAGGSASSSLLGALRKTKVSAD